MADQDDLPRVRASSLPRLFLCPGSRHRQEPYYDSCSEAAVRGTELHRELQAYLSLGFPESLPAAHLMGAALFAGEVTGQFVGAPAEGRPTWTCEGASEAMFVAGGEAALLTGTIDFVHQTKDRVHIVDWKSGRGAIDYHAQLMGYALIVLKSLPKSRQRRTKITISTYYLDLGQHHTLDLSVEDIEAFEQRLGEVFGNETFNVGSHCDYCPNRFACPERLKVLEGVTRILGTDITDIADTCLHYEGLRQLQKDAAAIQDVAKDYVRNVGDYDLGTHVLTSQWRTTKRLSQKRAIEFLTPEQVAQATDSYETQYVVMRKKKDVEE